MNRTPSRCKHCKVKFDPEGRGARLHPECIEPWLALWTEKQKKKSMAEERAQAKAWRTHVREKKASMKTKPELIREAQWSFNRWVRERDRLAGHACISSGRPLDWTGNGVDAGHYRSIGSAPHLRFHEDNVHAQSKHDNQYKAGNAVDYRIGLIARIGLGRVEALEADQSSPKWTHDDLRAIKATYVAKLKALRGAKKENE